MTIIKQMVEVFNGLFQTGDFFTVKEFKKVFTEYSDQQFGNSTVGNFMWKLKIAGFCKTRKEDNKTFYTKLQDIPEDAAKHFSASPYKFEHFVALVRKDQEKIQELPEFVKVPKKDIQALRIRIKKELEDKLHMKNEINRLQKLVAELIDENNEMKTTIVALKDQSSDLNLENFIFDNDE